jgi:hypothetical protein
MRRGYKVREGERLRQEPRALVQERNRYCH